MSEHTKPCPPDVSGERPRSVAWSAGGRPDLRDEGGEPGATGRIGAPPSAGAWRQQAASSRCSEQMKGPAMKIGQMASILDLGGMPPDEVERLQAKLASSAITRLKLRSRRCAR